MNNAPKTDHRFSRCGVQAATGRWSALDLRSAAGKPWQQNRRGFGPIPQWLGLGGKTTRKPILLFRLFGLLLLRLVDQRLPDELFRLPRLTRFVPEEALPTHKITEPPAPGKGKVTCAGQ